MTLWKKKKKTYFIVLFNMSKHFSLFNTEAQYQAAKDNLNYPNVSLIDTTGDLHYATYKGAELINAAFGDILICELSSGKHFYVSPENYTDTDYKNSQYWPIGVCIYDKASNSENNAVFMLNIPYQNPNYMGYMFCSGQYKFAQSSFTDDDLVYTNYNNNVSSININTYFRNKLTETSPELLLETDTTSTANQKKSTVVNYNYPMIYAAMHMSEFGFTNGDLLVPSYHDVSKAFATSVNNQHIIGESFYKIGVTPSFGFATCTSHTYNPKYNYFGFNSNNQNFRTNSSLISFEYASITTAANGYAYVRPVFIPHVEEL